MQKTEADKYDCHLLNEKDWSILPSIRFIDNKGPVVMTYTDHNNGTNKFMIHLCCQPHHNFSADISDQLCHAVIKSRAIKPTKAAQCSNTFSMHKQHGTFNGIDTCSVTTFCKFDFISKLSCDAEARSIQTCPDINALLTTLAQQKVLSEFVVKERLKEAIALTDNIDFETYHESATYVPLQVAMYFQSWEYGKPIIATIETSGNEVEFKPCWPYYIFHVRRVIHLVQ
eukprot:15367136-Ditylum_brightwellii.AAC.1